MKEILARLDEFDYIKTIIFAEEVILKVLKKTHFYYDCTYKNRCFLCLTRNPSINGQCAIVSFRFTQRASLLRRL